MARYKGPPPIRTEKPKVEAKTNPEHTSLMLKLKARGMKQKLVYEKYSAAKTQAEKDAILADISVDAKMRTQIETKFKNKYMEEFQPDKLAKRGPDNPVWKMLAKIDEEEEKKEVTHATLTPEL